MNKDDDLVINNSREDELAAGPFRMVPSRSAFLPLFPALFLLILALLAPDTCTGADSAPGTLLPMRLAGGADGPGRNTVLPMLAQLSSAPAGTASLSGRVIPPGPDSEVRLLYEGRERAAVRTDSEGRYEFKEVPAGNYEIQVSSPGHAEDRAPVTLEGDRKAEHTAVLLPITSVEGVDWAAGKVRARGVGLPPQDAPGATVRREMTERSALADGQRNLLRIIGHIRLDSGRDIGAAMRNRNFAERIEGFVKGYSVVSKREFEDGKVEVILELPLTGPSGLSRYIIE
jgi:hypothetical protein